MVMYLGIYILLRQLFRYGNFKKYSFLRTAPPV